MYTFKLEKFANWVITYSLTSDSWTIIKDDGFTYSFGQNGVSNSKEFVSTWGNWIGDSNQTPTGVSCIVWNLSEIKDQWDNKVNLKYITVEGRQNASQTTNKHTEASYLKEVSCSNGAKIVLNYLEKNLQEYYISPQQFNEPDAYQERRQTKYLNSVDIFNNSQQLVSSYDLINTIETQSTNNQKRYLTQIEQISHLNGQSSQLPPQSFEYHTTGQYIGGLKKITYPSGGTTTYNYQNKLLFVNGPNLFKTSQNWPTGYSFYSAVVKDNYSILVLRTDNAVSGDYRNRFKFFRYWWNGQKWESNEFTFPHLIKDRTFEYVFTRIRLEGFYSILEEDFYGFAYDKGEAMDIYLWHKEKTGNTWKYYQHIGINIGSEDEGPTFMSGDNFVAVGSRLNGNLNTYVWNGSNWNHKRILQGNGQYYYSARNNFILSLDEDGGSDMITGVNHEDNYYIHYLDLEKKWQTKSWSASLDPHILGIEKPSQFYPSNSMTAFVADDNPELFLRWDKDYNIIAVDNVIGYHPDDHYFQSVDNSMFTFIDPFINQPRILSRFNGFSWNVNTLPESRFYPNLGIDKLVSEADVGQLHLKLNQYYPNTDSWSQINLDATPSRFYPSNAVNSEFIIGGESIYSVDSPSTSFLPLLKSIDYTNEFSYSDGLSHSYIKQIVNDNFQKATYYYMDKSNGQLTEVDLGLKDYLIGSRKLGGYTPFMSTQAMWLKQDNGGSFFNPYLYRIINDKISGAVTDFVVGEIELDNKNDVVRKVAYSYTNPNSLSNNSATFYGEVTKENKGFGNSSIGKIKKIFDNGVTDIRLLGSLLEEQVLDTDNNVEKKSTNTWLLDFKYLYNGSSLVDVGYQINLQNKSDELFLNSSSIINNTSFTYNNDGKLISKSSTNSKGLVERQEIKYAYQQYPFVYNKNMFNEPYETITKLNNEVVDIKKTIWINESSNVYVKEKWSGPNQSSIRLDSEITVVDNLGNLLEVNQGNEIHNSILMGYNNLYEVASINNAKYQDVVNQLDVSYTQLQNLTTSNLKIELLKLYDRLPNAMIGLSFYDENGRITNQVNERKEESYIYYDNFGRVDYITDGYGNVIKKKEYNFGN